MSSETPIREEKKAKRRDPGSAWFGMALITLGIIFFAQQLGDFRLNNWWAIFILIPVSTKGQPVEYVFMASVGGKSRSLNSPSIG